MKKNSYISPAIRINKICISHHLLAGSDQVQSNTSNQIVITKTSTDDESGSRGFSFFDDED